MQKSEKASTEATFIEIIGDKENNLKNISVRIPHNSLTVITGVSGSGKSTLGYNTIFAEGQRRYMDTFSSYARSYMGTMKKPDADRITGLSPVISIDQHTISRNPRSTVGTITEVYDFIRLLFARVGTAYSYITGEKMVQLTDEQIETAIRSQFGGKEISILAPIVNNRKGHYKELFENYRRKGYMYARIDGRMQEVEIGLKLDRYANHSIDIFVDKIRIQDGMDVHRFTHSLDTAFTLGEGMLVIVDADGMEQVFSRKLMCPTSKISYVDPSPFNFSFNSPKGWCPTCRGLGFIYKKEDLLSEEDKELDDIIHDENWQERIKSYLETKRQDNRNNKDEGSDEDKEETVLNNDTCLCPDCQGRRLNKEALSYRIGDKTIHDWVNMDLLDLYRLCKQIYSDGTMVDFTPKQVALSEPILKEIISRLEFMLSIGLSYLKLSLPAGSLSGGESQRIRLATQLGSNLVHVLYILDEPSIGLHQRDNDRLIQSLKRLRDMGNTVVVIEHDEQIMREADYIIDIGPGAGIKGGEVMFEGTPQQLLKTNTLTALYLNGKRKKMGQRDFNLTDTTPCLTLYGCKGNNLKSIDVRFPLGCMIGVSGVSGSGKSTLINETLYPILAKKLYRSGLEPLPYERVEGLEHIDKVLEIDQSPICRNPRSTPATYTGVLTDIRELFAQLEEAKIRSWSSRQFSYNLRGGRCEECFGYGYKVVKLFFLPDVHVECDACNGKRYNNETLQVKFKGKSIADVLNMTIDEAVEFFDNQAIILRKIKSLQDVGLGYLKLGQASNTLSGGENQRVKLAAELARSTTGKTLCILDEPTTGLHFEDIQVLLRQLRKLIELGNTVIVIEHNLDVLRCCDYLIDLGPEGGVNGGQVITCGTVADVKHSPISITAKYL